MQHPFLSKAFPIAWKTLTAEPVEADISKALEDAQGRVDKVAAQDLASVSFSSTLLALDKATEDLSEAWSKVGHLDAVANAPSLREAYNAMLPKVSEFYTQLPLNDKLWAVLKAFSQTEEASALTGTRKRLLDETLADFREAGADLPNDKKQRLAQINAELAKVTQKFSENVLDATNAWELFMDDESRLAGLPKSAKEAARLDALKKGQGTQDAPKWRFTLHMPSLLPALTYLEDRELREQIWRASCGVGLGEPYDNTALLWSVLELRDEKAKVLGKAHFADYTTSRRMAGSGQAALGFIEDLHKRVQKAFAEDVQQLREFASKSTDAPLEPWDVAYYSEAQRKADYDFDEEDLRPYFPINRVIDGLFELAQKVFDVTIKEKTDVETWHEEVKYYDMFDVDGRHMGAFYADWHPRESKRGGAWMNYFRTGSWSEDTPKKWEPHIGLICGNLTPSVGDEPALLTHREVETIFHEFGHLLHHLSGEVDIRSLNGINVVWDFVELPSQIMENWCWERESLDLFARHYKTGEAIPQELFDKMLAARNYQSAMATMRQLSFSKLDLELHLHYAQWKGRDLDELVKELLADYTMDFPTKPPTMARRFTHLFADPTGYAAGYYSYKWAEVLDADAFSRFKNEGILNPEVGRAFRKTILSKGNSEPAEKLFRDFMGRDPDQNALLVRSGIVAE